MTAQETTNLRDRGARESRDSLTIDAAKYLALRSNGPNGPGRAAAAYPELDAAVALNDDDAKTETIKLLVLVDSSIETVAQRAGIKAEIIAIWEKLYFDVRGMLSATDWLTTHVLGKARKAGNGALAARMTLALGAGIEGANAALALDDGAPLDEAERLFQRKVKLGLKFDEAAEMPINSECSRMAFLKLYADLRASERRLEFAEKKLAARCTEACNRFKLAKLRMEHVRELAALKAEAKQQRAERRRLAREEQSAEAALFKERKRRAQAAEQKAASCRIAESPLTRLSWSTPKSNSPVLAETVLTLSIDRQPEPTHRYQNRADFQNRDVRADHRHKKTKAQRLKIATPGAA